MNQLSLLNDLLLVIDDNIHQWPSVRVGTYDGGRPGFAVRGYDVGNGLE